MIIEFQIKVTLLSTIFPPFRGTSAQCRPSTVEGKWRSSAFLEKIGRFHRAMLLVWLSYKRWKHFLWQCEWFLSSQIAMWCCIMGSACRKISWVNNFRIRPFVQCDLKTEYLYKRPCCSFCIAIVLEVKILGTREGAEKRHAGRWRYFRRKGGWIFTNSVLQLYQHCHYCTGLPPKR